MRSASQIQILNLILEQDEEMDFFLSLALAVDKPIFGWVGPKMQTETQGPCSTAEGRIHMLYAI